MRGGCEAACGAACGMRVWCGMGPREQSKGSPHTSTSTQTPNSYQSGCGSLAERWSHNPKVRGSSPINTVRRSTIPCSSFFLSLSHSQFDLHRHAAQATAHAQSPLGALLRWRGLGGRCTGAACFRLPAMASWSLSARPSPSSLRADTTGRHGLAGVNSPSGCRPAAAWQRPHPCHLRRTRPIGALAQFKNHCGAAPGPWQPPGGATSARQAAAWGARGVWFTRARGVCVSPAGVWATCFGASFPRAPA